MGNDVYCIKVRGGIVAQNEHNHCPKCSHLWVYSAHTRLNYFCFFECVFFCLYSINACVDLHACAVELFFCNG